MSATSAVRWLGHGDVGRNFGLSAPEQDEPTRVVARPRQALLPREQRRKETRLALERPIADQHDDIGAVAHFAHACRAAARLAHGAGGAAKPFACCMIDDAAQLLGQGQRP